MKDPEEARKARFARSIVRSLPLLLKFWSRKFNVTIRQFGEEAYTDGNVVTVPDYLPENQEQADTLLGYTAHECGHVRFTDFSVVQSCRGKVEHHIQNILEDARIENRMMEYLPGLRRMFSGMRYNETEMETWNNYREAVKKGEVSELQRLFTAMLIYDQAVCNGYTPARPMAAEALREARKVITVPALRQITGICRRVREAKDTNDVMDLTREILKVLKNNLNWKDVQDQMQQQQQAQNQPGQTREAGGMGGGSPQESAQQGDQQNGQSQGSGQGAVGSGADQDDQESQEQGEGSSQGEEQGKDQQDSRGQGGGSGADQDDQEQGQGSAQGQDQGKDHQDSRGEDAGQPQNGMDVSSGGAQQGGDMQQRGGGKGYSKTGGSGLKPNTGKSGDRLKQAEKEFKDREDAEAKPCIEIKEMVRHDSEGRCISPEYENRNFTVTDSQTEFTYCKEGREDFLNQLDPSYHRIAGQMRRFMMGYVANKKADEASGGLRINVNKAMRMPLGETKIFYRADQEKAPSTHISLLLDASGSMSGDRIECTNLSALALCMALDEIADVKTSVNYFTSDGDGAKIYTCKKPGDRTRRIARRFDQGTGGGTPAAEAVSWVLKNIRSETDCDRNILLVLSDGAFDTDSFKILNERAALDNVELCGIGIHSDNLKEAIPNTVELDDPKEIGQKMAELLENTLLNDQQRKAKAAAESRMQGRGARR